MDKKDKLVEPGVIYLSSLPPFMKPEKVRHLLTEFGSIDRIYLEPEDSSVRSKRLKSGGNRKMNYTEGWVEFKDKKVAKKVAKMLHLQRIGKKKREFYYDDVWCLKYLKHLKWNHLSEKIAYEQRIQTQKRKLELSKSIKENKDYLEKVNLSNTIQTMEKRRKIDKVTRRYFIIYLLTLIFIVSSSDNRSSNKFSLAMFQILLSWLKCLPLTF